MSHVVFTGPITGTVQCADGTVYDVSAPWVEVNPAHADEVAHLIGQHYATEGHPMVPEGFVYDQKG